MNNWPGLARNLGNMHITIPEQPFPQGNKFIMENFVLNSTRLYFPPFGPNDQLPVADKLGALSTNSYGDELLVQACIRWLNFPLQTLPRTDECSNSWKFPLLSRCERILHIGRRDHSLYMGQIWKFVQTIADVCLNLLAIRTHKNI